MANLDELVKFIEIKRHLAIKNGDGTEAILFEQVADQLYRLIDLEK